VCIFYKVTYQIAINKTITVSLMVRFRFRFKFRDPSVHNKPCNNQASVEVFIAQ